MRRDTLDRMRFRAARRSTAAPDRAAAPRDPAHEPPPDELARVRDLYLRCMKGALTHTLYRPMDVRFENAGYVLGDEDEMREAVSKEFSKEDFDWADVRADGRDWPRFAQTMVGLQRLENVERCVAQVLADGVPGDLIETGVWRGGVVIFMRAILEAYGDRSRHVFAADSFRGLPAPDEAYPADAGNRLHTAEPLAIARSEVERNFALYGLLDERVHLVEGWFADTLPALADRTWAVARLDGDMYGSTIDALTNLYPRLSVGGFLIVDDYGFEPCRRAVDDYRAEHGIEEPIEQIDWLGAFWRRER
jgi:O-methyltransferase